MKKEKLLEKYKVCIYMQPYEYIVEATSRESAEDRVLKSQAIDTMDIYKIVTNRYLS